MPASVDVPVGVSRIAACRPSCEGVLRKESCFVLRRAHGPSELSTTRAREELEQPLTDTAIPTSDVPVLCRSHRAPAPPGRSNFDCRSGSPSPGEGCRLKRIETSSVVLGHTHFAMREVYTRCVLFGSHRGRSHRFALVPSRRRVSECVISLRARPGIRKACALDPVPRLRPTDFCHPLPIQSPTRVLGSRSASRLAPSTNEELTFHDVHARFGRIDVFGRGCSPRADLDCAGISERRIRIRSWPLTPLSHHRSFHTALADDRDSKRRCRDCWLRDPVKSPEEETAQGAFHRDPARARGRIVDPGCSQARKLFA